MGIENFMPKSPEKQAESDAIEEQRKLENPELQKAGTETPTEQDNQSEELKQVKERMEFRKDLKKLLTDLYTDYNIETRNGVVQADIEAMKLKYKHGDGELPGFVSQLFDESKPLSGGNIGTKYELDIAGVKKSLDQVKMWDANNPEWKKEWDKYNLK
ncbi:MAG: hypothetical protein Q7S19_02140 [bacterium]|nr:hypothetical protein [bacterium]